MTKIAWADSTINPIVGCSKISAGCQNCYAENMARRLSATGLEQYQYTTLDSLEDKHSGWNGRAAYAPTALEKPYKWRKPRSIFVCSMGDLFHESVWRCWVDDVMRMVANNSQHTFIFLTKRPGRMKQYFDLCDRELVEDLTAYYQLSHNTTPHNLSANWPLPNLVLGVSVENQQTADERIPILLATPAAKRFVSIEPMLGPVQLPMEFEYFDPDGFTNNGPGAWHMRKSCIDPDTRIDGVILGGESGPKARPLDPDWVRSVRDQCSVARVPFMFKQGFGEKFPLDQLTGFPKIDGRIHAELCWTNGKRLL